MVSIDVNNQTDFEINTTQLEKLIDWFASREEFPCEELSVGVIGDDEMARLNETYYDESGTTDVLSFNYGDGTGEILLNPYQQRRQCDQFDNDLNEEFAENVVHALLHLTGYDHLQDEGEQLQRQANLVEEWFNSSRESDLILAGET